MRIDCRRALIPRCLVREEVSDLSELGDPFKMLIVKDKLVDGAAAAPAGASGGDGKGSVAKKVKGALGGSKNKKASLLAAVGNIKVAAD